MSAVRFLVDGDRIQPTQSPDDLDMVDGDTIEVMMYVSCHTFTAVLAGLAEPY